MSQRDAVVVSCTCHYLRSACAHQVHSNYYLGDILHYGTGVKAHHLHTKEANVHCSGLARSCALGKNVLA